MINVAEHPARMACGTRLAATVFPGSYKRAAVMQVSLLLAATISSIAAWTLSSGIEWLIGGLLTFVNLPYTLIVIMPINKQLLSDDIDKDSPHTKALLT